MINNLSGIWKQYNSLCVLHSKQNVITSTTSPHTWAKWCSYWWKSKSNWYVESLLCFKMIALKTNFIFIVQGTLKAWIVANINKLDTYSYIFKHIFIELFLQILFTDFFSIWGLNSPHNYGNISKIQTSYFSDLNE